MDRKIAISLFSFILFLAWYLFGKYVSNGDEWWTVLYVEQTSEDTFIARVSVIKLLIGAIISSLIGFILYIIIRKK